MEAEITEQKELTRSEKISLSTTEIARRIREKLKEEFKNCQFSSRTEYYSCGSSISVYLMKATGVKIVKDFSEIPQEAIARLSVNNYTEENVKALQMQSNHQLNRYTLTREYNPLEWCNGVFLTEEGHNILKRVVEIADEYNYDESDIQTDYYSVNFSFDISIGKWDKDFIQL